MKNIPMAAEDGLRKQNDAGYEDANALGSMNVRQVKTAESKRFIWVCLKICKTRNLKN